MANEFIKRPNELSEFTLDQAQELQRCATDPIYFMKNYTYVLHPTRGKVKFALFDYQEEMVQAFLTNRLNITMASRQLGKTVTAAMYLLWFAIFKFDKTVLVVAHKNKHAMEIVHRIKYAYEELPNWLKPGVKYYTKHEMESDNGSKIISEATTETSGRGESISLLYCDEFAYVRGNIQQLFWTSIQPTLSTGGSAIITSTPNGDSELFAALWRGAISGINGFIPYLVLWYRHPERPADYDKEAISQLGELKWRQEGLCEFLSSEELLINSLKLHQLKSVEPLFIERGFKFWGHVDPGKTYYVGCDVSAGVGNDFSTIQVVEFPSMVQFAEFRENKISPPQFYSKIKWILKYLTTPNEFHGNNYAHGKQVATVYWSFENNGVGVSIGALYQNDETFPEASLISDDNRLGVVTTNKTKVLASIELKRLIEKTRNCLTVNSEILLHELKNYISNGKNTYVAKVGMTDDLIAALLVIMQIFKKTAGYEQQMFDVVYDYTDDNEVDFDDPFGGEAPPMVF